MSVSCVLSGLYSSLSKKLNDAVAFACRSTEFQPFAACLEITKALPEERDFQVPGALNQLAVWGYSLHHEAAKGCLPYLNKIGKFYNSLAPIDEIVAVRHFLCHNNVKPKTLERARAWFNKQCGCLEPNDPASYLACSRALYGLLADILTKANEAAAAAFDDETLGLINARQFTRAIMGATKGGDMAKRFANEYL